MIKKIGLCALLISMSCASLAAAAQPLPPSSPAIVTDAKIQLLQKLHQRAEESILKNDLSSAVRIYGDILLEEPDDETAYTGLGQCYLILGDFPRAKNAYLNALHINPENETALMGLKKIEDPDSMAFTEEYTAKVPVSEPGIAATEPSPATTQAPTDPEAGVKADEIRLGAKKTMAPYSLDVPQQLRNRTHEQTIQVALKNAGFYRGPIDGIFGQGTRKAIRDFQEKYDLVVDGKVGPKTWELLQPFINQNGFEKKD